MVKRILLVEDNAGDVVIMQEIFSLIDPSVQLEISGDGADAMVRLQKMAAEVSGELPALILLDINIPKYNGFEVLQYMKSQRRLGGIPVIVCSTSSYHNDRIKALYNKADDFVTKPSDFNEFQIILQRVYSKWIQKDPGLAGK